MRQGESIHLEIPSSPEYVAVVRRAIEGIAQRMHFNAAQIEDLKVAVGEACANAILHGCPRSEENNVEVHCEVRADGLLVEVRNTVEGQCRPHIPAKPELNREGGLGLYIINQLMDEVQFTWTNRTAVLRMLKRL